MEKQTVRPQTQKYIALWLLICVGMVFVMAVIGAITRLTESGLSMVEWRPLLGIVPPLSLTEWERIFTLYQQTPEYIHKNNSITLQEFKTIFWWEWFHRFWGRILGIVFFLPLVWFWLRGWLSPALLYRLGGILILGLLQGVMGWVMVMSGLVDRPSVSHYRLVLHLVLALMIMGLLFWQALNLLRSPYTKTTLVPVQTYTFACILLSLLLLTIVWGGFVAGLDAGLIYNTFPLMNQYWIPPEFMILTPWWSNLFDNHATVQWIHRYFGLMVGLFVLLFWYHTAQISEIRRIVNMLVTIVLLQISLGIALVLLQVPVVLGVVHQIGALSLFLTLLWLLHRITTRWRT